MNYEVISALKRLKEKSFQGKGLTMCWVIENPKMDVCFHPRDEEEIDFKFSIPLQEVDQLLKEHGFTKYTDDFGERIYLNNEKNKAVRLDFLDDKVYHIILVPCKVVMKLF